MSVDGVADACSGLVVQDDDGRSPGEARLGGDERHHTHVAFADLKRLFAESNAAHRHGERVAF